ncbi:TetR/AcrR family transcriptional regulator [Streptomyces turgidiscabies]|uniref:AcrR family transcriptional regulator n=1 Tax=Streptomyces turgidiscabies TaxID=85558 RepID=A0ABU0RXQ3_9ACTN|nr:TetR/AcrR family transcriptional regulator [Streptomyces turgidiscabies]MDQ0936756.1 AcrR family transcriptional regulator [Streptomyces turgidiscabies]
MDATTATAAGRPMRADARRNYVRLLTAAKAAFAEHGTDASLDDIARRAEVGIGTLYRHFPSRQELLEAVFHDSIEGLCEQATALLDDPVPGDAMMNWLRAVAEHATTYRGLAGSLMSTRLGDEAGPPPDCHVRMLSAGDALLGRAQRSHAIRPDVQISELLRLANGVAFASRLGAEDTDQVDRLLELVLRGLVPRG